MLSSFVFQSLVLGQAFPVPGFDDDAGIDSANVTLYILIGLAALLVLFQIMLAVWVVKDSKKSAKSPGWAAFVAVPGLGIIGLLIYILLPSGMSPEERMRRQQMAQMQQQLANLQNEKESIRADADRRVQEAMNQTPLVAPVNRKHTQVINAVPSRVIHLTQYGGRNHGMSFPLNMREPDGSVRRNHIGRSARCELSFPEDTGISDEHCVILEDATDNVVYVIDVGSTNGTILERGDHIGKIAAKTPLQDGDYLKIGETRLRVQIIDPLETPTDVGVFKEG